MTQIVNIKNHKYETYIGRPSLWGNPFRIGHDGTRTDVINKYRRWLRTQPYLQEQMKTDLKDKILGCHCKPLACHGDVILEVCEGFKI